MEEKENNGERKTGEPRDKEGEKKRKLEGSTKEKKVKGWRWRIIKEAKKQGKREKREKH